MGEAVGGMAVLKIIEPSEASCGFHAQMACVSLEFMLE